METDWKRHLPIPGGGTPKHVRRGWASEGVYFMCQHLATPYKLDLYTPKPFQAGFIYP